MNKTDIQTSMQDKLMTGKKLNLTKMEANEITSSEKTLEKIINANYIIKK